MTSKELVDALNTLALGIEGLDLCDTPYHFQDDVAVLSLHCRNLADRVEKDGAREKRFIEIREKVAKLHAASFKALAESGD